MNVGLDKSISDSKCYPLVAGEAGSLRDCQAKCTAREHCNTVNWHERNTICKQYMCLKQIGMRTYDILGYEIYTWITSKASEVCARASSLCFQFHVGAWGECLNMPNFTSDWRFTPPTKWSDCELVKSRPVVCKGSDGKTYPDSFCMTSRSPGGRKRHLFASVPADSTERATNSRGTVVREFRNAKVRGNAVTSALTRRAARCLFSVNTPHTGTRTIITSDVMDRPMTMADYVTGLRIRIKRKDTRGQKTRQRIITCAPTVTLVNNALIWARDCAVWMSCSPGNRTTSIRKRFTNEVAVMDARFGRQHRAVQVTKAFLPQQYTRTGKILESSARCQRSYTTWRAAQTGI